MENNYKKSLLKWAGNKRRYLKYILPLFTKKYRNFYDPFCGSLVIENNIEFYNDRNYYFSDINSKLIDFYRIIKDKNKIGKFILSCFELDLLEINEENYYKIRDLFNNNEGEDYQLASYFLYLNKRGFSGIYRENYEGKFNIPYGKNQKCKLFDENVLNNLHSILNKPNVYLYNNDFFWLAEIAKKEDFIYFDSPFYGTFDKYSKKGFKEKDHESLRELFYYLDNKEVKLAMSNIKCSWVIDSYFDYNILEYDVSYFNKEDRKEVLITNYKE